MAKSRVLSLQITATGAPTQAMIKPVRSKRAVQPLKVQESGTTVTIALNPVRVSNG